MEDYSTNDINEAKRRVREMRSKARDYVAPAPPVQNEAPHKENNKEDTTVVNSGIGDLISGIFKSGDSSLILAMVLILSHEKADNMLILALLYILL